MAVVVITPPEPLVSLEQAKRWLRVEHGDDDGLISSLIEAAQRHLDGPTGLLGRALGRQTLEYGLSQFGGSQIDLPCPPVVEVLSVTYANSVGADQTWGPVSWRLFDRGLDRWSLAPSYGGTWPLARLDHGSIRIRYRAGYETPPAPLQQAILLLTAHWYANREPVNVGNITTELPLGVSVLIAPYRIWRV